MGKYPAGNADGYGGNRRSDQVRRFFLSERSYQELKEDYLAFAVTVVDIVVKKEFIW